MAEVDEQTKRDALFIFDALKHVTTKVIVNAGEIALHKDVKINTIETRFSAIKKRHNLNISTTTTGFAKQRSTTLKKARPAIDRTPGNHGTATKPTTRTLPKSSAKKRQADAESWYGNSNNDNDDDDDGNSTPTKRYRAEMEVDRSEDVASWQAVTGGPYDGVFGLDGARGFGY